MSFNETRFPTDISFGSAGGPMRKTSITPLASGFEHRNATWFDSRRAYNAQYGIKSLDQLKTVLDFFEAHNGRLIGFRYKDHLDFKSSLPSVAISDTDQSLGTGDGVETDFQIKKKYTSGAQSYDRNIKKPVTGTVVCAIDGTPTAAFTVDTTTGIVSFNVAPADTTVLTCGFEFDVPVRFDTDFLDYNMTTINAGAFPSIPIVEIKI